MSPLPDDLPSVPVFDKTLPVKQMHVLETLDLLILRADKGDTPLPGGVLWERGKQVAFCGRPQGSQWHGSCQLLPCGWSVLRVPRGPFVL